ncbi:hypothetical protein AURDEDRAFT_153969 [Auricularia subglabra TFB-10046 SS5]|uniref:Uncharacterized protein n=1 Tax=Auricularia subglabra (strain TFB-10046 / SS5) TaxID=717982 RepID=J0DBW8_AURST|nr:hypothetical protein AURDEDRAFT_153969 [Auricularia subglabra TFB-10046 SS5]
MKTATAPTRRPSLMQLFGLRDRTNTVLVSAAAADRAVKHAELESSAPPPQKKAKKAAQAQAYDEAELVRRYGRAFISEVALLQFMDGGSTEHNVRRVLKRRAKMEQEEARTRLLSEEGDALPA